MDPKPDGKLSESSDTPAPVSDAPTIRAVTKRQEIAIPRELASLPNDANAHPGSLLPLYTKPFRDTERTLAKRRRLSLLFVGLAGLVTAGTAGAILVGKGSGASTLHVEALGTPSPPVVAVAAAAATSPASEAAVVAAPAAAAEAAPVAAVEPALGIAPAEGIAPAVGGAAGGVAPVEGVAPAEVAAPSDPVAPGEAVAAGVAEDALALLPRAEQLLRSDRRAAAAQEARALLEQVVAAYPINPHAQIALAEACLRLRDGPCAHKAVARAIKLRPAREPYRALEQEIQAAFE
jgi:hypothetical protein